MIGSMLGRATTALTTVAVALGALGAASANAATYDVCSSGCPYTTVQGAVYAALGQTSGTSATISVGSGAYQESINIPAASPPTVPDISFSIVGAGVSKTTIEAKPSTIAANELSADGLHSYPVINAEQTLSISNLRIDGLGDGASAGSPFAAIGEYDSNLTVNDVEITGFTDTPPDTAATGDGIWAVNDTGPTTRTLTVDNSLIADYQQDGIVAYGNSNLGVEVAGDAISGDGGPANAGGIFVVALAGGGSGPSGAVTNDTITGNTTAAPLPILNDEGPDGAGIRLEDVSDFAVSGNSVSNNDVGVWSSAGTGAIVTTSGNTLEDSTYADALAGFGTNVVSQNTIGSLPDATQTPVGVLVAGYAEDPASDDATVTANTISATDSAVEVAVGKNSGAVAPTATITNNALFGNTNGVENATSATVDAIDNWWGCNGGPGANGCPDILYPNPATDGTVTAAPYLVFGVSAAPGSIAPGASSTIVAGIRQNSAGTSFASGPFPSGPLVTLATTAGSLPSSAELVNGEAATTLSNTPVGTATLSGTLESQTATTTVTTANSVSTASSTAPNTVTVTVTVPATVAPLISFLGSNSLSLFASNPGSPLTVTCVDGCAATVAGTITVKERQGKHKTVRKMFTLTTASPTIGANGAYVYGFALSSAERSALKHALSATLTLNASAKDDSTGKVATDSKTFTLTRS